MANIKCKCGGDGECTCKAVGDGSVSIVFTFYCGTCNNLERNGKNVDSPDNEAMCPFCSQSSKEHKETSQILRNMKACG